MPDSETVRKGGRPRGFDRGTALHRALETFWRRGYEPTTISELCQAMGINSPSLYLTFGNKASLFLEAVEHYEEQYWSGPWQVLANTPNPKAAIEYFLRTAAAVLVSPETPFGCVVVLSAMNVSAASEDVEIHLRALREMTRTRLSERLRRGVAEGDLAPETDVEALAGLFTAVLQGMSVQARDGAPEERLVAIAAAAVAVLRVS